MKFKLLTIMSLMLLTLVGAVMAGGTTYETVLVKDDQGSLMSGVDVQVNSTCGWGPKSGTTNGNGAANFAVQKYCNYDAFVTGGADGYVCTTDANYIGCRSKTLNIVCTPTEEVPEFGVLAALGVLGLAGLFIFKKRED